MNQDQYYEKFVAEFENFQTSYGVHDRHILFNQQNWENARNELILTIEAIDSDDRAGFFNACFPNGEDDNCSRGESSFNGRTISAYGRQLICARYAIGWLGNLSQATPIDPPAVQALAFIYAVYWHLGKDFLLGNIVENFLHRLGKPEYVDTSDLVENPSTTLGFEIWREILHVFNWHYIHQGSVGRFATTDGEKPKFRKDFLESVQTLLEELEAS